MCGEGGSKSVGGFSVTLPVACVACVPRSPSGRFLALLRFPNGSEGRPVAVGAKPGSPPLALAQVRG